MASEREITAPVSLTSPDGRLNPDAVGWTRMPLHDTDGIGRGAWWQGSRRWGRTKRWEYWAVTTPTHAVGVTVSDIDYAGVNALFVLDRRTGEQIVTELIAPLARGVRLPGTLDAGRSRFRSAALTIAILPDEGSTRISARTKRVELDVRALLPSDHERLGVVVPWSARTFQYTVKDIGRPAEGTLTVDGTAYPLEPGEAWASLDHGRGRWPYDIAWNWGAGAGVVHGHTVGLQLGGRWTDGTGSTENAITVDGRLTKISDELVWTYDPADWLAPWTIHGGPVEAAFTPEHVRAARTQLGVLASTTHQCFGTWAGRVGGVRLDGLYGWAEDVHQRW